MPKLTAREKRYHLALIDDSICVCGCGRQATLVHHPLQEHPDQRTRRNHEYVVPMYWECHDRLHRHGSDQYADAAAEYRAKALESGML